MGEQNRSIYSVVSPKMIREEKQERLTLLQI